MKLTRTAPYCKPEQVRLAQQETLCTRVDQRQCSTGVTLRMPLLFAADTQSVSSSGGSPVVSSVMLKPEKKWAGSVGEEGSGFSCATFLLCDPRRWFHRYTALMLMCFLSFGSYYVYDNPAALTQTIITVPYPSPLPLKPHPLLRAVKTLFD